MVKAVVCSLLLWKIWLWFWEELPIGRLQVLVTFRDLYETFQNLCPLQLTLIMLEKFHTPLCLGGKPGSLIVSEVPRAEGVEGKKINRLRRKCSKKVMLMVTASPHPSLALGLINASWHVQHLLFGFMYLGEFLWFGDGLGFYSYLVLFFDSVIHWTSDFIDFFSPFSTWPFTPVSIRDRFGMCLFSSYHHW